MTATHLYDPDPRHPSRGCDVCGRGASVHPRVSADQAKAVLAKVREAFRLSLDADRWHARTFRTGAKTGPSLVRNYDPYWGGGRVPYAILWEDGPSEWVYRFTGGDTKVDPKVPGVFLEAGTSFVLLLFPDVGDVYDQPGPLDAEGFSGGWREDMRGAVGAPIDLG